MRARVTTLIVTLALVLASAPLTGATTHGRTGWTDLPDGSVLTGTVHAHALRVPAGVTVTVTGDVVMRASDIRVDGDVVQRVAATLILEAERDLTVTGTIRAAPGDAGRDAAHAALARAQDGHAGGSVHLTVTGPVGSLTVTPGAVVAAGSGGRGGDAHAIAANPDQSSAIAHAGRGGSGGLVLVNAPRVDVRGDLVPGDGGAGGTAYAVGSRDAVARGGHGGTPGGVLLPGPALVDHGGYIEVCDQRSSGPSAGSGQGATAQCRGMAGAAGGSAQFFAGARGGNGGNGGEAYAYGGNGECPHPPPRDGCVGKGNGGDARAYGGAGGAGGRGGDAWPGTLWVWGGDGGHGGKGGGAYALAGRAVCDPSWDFWCESQHGHAVAESTGGNGGHGGRNGVAPETPFGLSACRSSAPGKCWSERVLSFPSRLCGHSGEGGLAGAANWVHAESPGGYVYEHPKQTDGNPGLSPFNRTLCTHADGHEHHA